METEIKQDQQTLENVLDKKTFKDYYADPEYKAKHLKYLKEKVKCECGAMLGRVNLGPHKKSWRHKKAMGEDVSGMRGRKREMLSDDVKKQIENMVKLQVELRMKEYTDSNSENE